MDYNIFAINKFQLFLENAHFLTCKLAICFLDIIFISYIFALKTRIKYQNLLQNPEIYIQPMCNPCQIHNI